MSAAILLANEGKSTRVGGGIEDVFTNTNHTNPLCRVTPIQLIKEDEDFDYDRQKYRDLLLEAAETILSYFGFDRTTCGDFPKTNRKSGGEGSMKKELRIGTLREYRPFSIGFTKRLKLDMTKCMLPPLSAS